MKPTILFFLLLFSTQIVFGQNLEELNERLTNQRFETQSKLLNYRFKGGSGEFERIFFEQVNYTEEARKNCIVGVVILTFTVSCDNNISDLKMRNPMHYGLNEELQKFIEATEGRWNTCQDEKYTRFEIPVLFTLKGTETSARGLLTLLGESPGFACRSDQYFMERFERYKRKGKVKKALENLDQLIRRDPYNNTFYDLKRELLEGETK
ncbi:MAG: energy transducer TonB [Bacteroidales bacterium]|nr:energy transducer TonB [Bacteroidales bacterium]